MIEDNQRPLTILTLGAKFNIISFVNRDLQEWINSILGLDSREW